MSLCINLVSIPNGKGKAIEWWSEPLKDPTVSIPNGKGKEMMIWRYISESL